MLGRRWFRGWIGLGALALLATLAVSCTDDSAVDKAATPVALTGAAVDCKALSLNPPESIRRIGKLVVASDLSYAPIDFVKEGTTEAIGLDADLAKCMTAAWGVKLEILNTSFDAIIPSLTSGKVDVIMSAMTNTEERRGTVDFVDYFVAGSGILVKSGNPQKIANLAGLCGRKVAIQVGTIQIQEAEAQNKQCQKKIEVQTFEQNTDAIQSVVSGRAQAALMDHPVAAYSAKNVKGTAVVGEQFNTAPYGIAIRKGDTAIRDAIAFAIEAMRKGGQYEAILKYWGLEGGKLP